MKSLAWTLAAILAVRTVIALNEYRQFAAISAAISAYNGRATATIDSLTRECRDAHAWAFMWRSRDSLHVAQAVEMGRGTRRAGDFKKWAKGLE